MQNNGKVSSLFPGAGKLLQWQAGMGYSPVVFEISRSEMGISMELPKNIVQIGNPDKHYRIFVEDYVISYMKQINRNLNGGQAGVALYGKKTVEEEQRYYFFYGASEISGLEDRGTYLSDMEREQIEDCRKEFFGEMEFLAWTTLGGEMPDGFFLLEQGKGLLINGYASFFEKNDNMLNFMITMGNRKRNLMEQERHVTERKTEDDFEWGRLAAGGNIDHRLLERSQKLLELRKGRKSEKVEKGSKWKSFLTAAALILCVVGIVTLSDEEKMKNVQTLAGRLWTNISEQKLPDAEKRDEEILANAPETKTIPEENSEPRTQSEPQPETQPESQPETQPQPQPESQTQPQPESQPQSRQEEVMAPQPEVRPVQATVTYVVKRGDMLLKICREHYGSDQRMEEICRLNGISDPDDIKAGQIILLPE